jgi:hypothetical protein
MSKSSRAFLAFTVSPFAPAVFYCLFAFRPEIHRHLRPQEWAALQEWATVVFTLTLCLTLPITLAVGVPAYLWIEKRTSTGLRASQVLWISGIAGAAVGGLAVAPHIGALLGLSAGLTFCLIWYRARDARAPF